MKEINGGKQMKDVWQFSLTPKREKQAEFPTQKPLVYLRELSYPRLKKEI